MGSQQKSFWNSPGIGHCDSVLRIGLKEVPVICLNMTAAEAKAYAVWDNRSSDLSHFDERRLGGLLAEIADLDIDMEDTGFSVGKADRLIIISGEFDEQDDGAPLDEASPAITRSGWLWDLNCHRISCGDSRSSLTFEKLMRGSLATNVITDVPYNLAGSAISGNGKIKHESFQMVAGEMSSAEYVSFLKTVIRLLVRFSTKGSLHYHFINW